MDEHNGPVTILVVDDDEDDRLMIALALKKARLLNGIIPIRDGEELMEYLYRRGSFTDVIRFPHPGLILLDLNMPRISGREALKLIKSDPKLRHIPVVVLTTSAADEDIRHCYDLGANAFITKPVTFTNLLRALTAVNYFWFEIVRRPKIPQ